MKILYISFILSLTHFYASAQISHFIYFQTENKQPFYVKIDNKILSSSPAGYLIVPKLKQGNYKIAFGFPKNEITEKVISYTVDKKDAGYIIKNFGEKGWGLFNLQTFDVIMPGDEIAAVKSPVRQTMDDAFSNMLATVVNDSTIRQREAGYDEVTNNEAKTEIIQTESTKEPDSFEAINTNSESSVSIITRTLNVINQDGVELMYTDRSGNQSDTIRIFFAAQNIENKKESQNEPNDNVAKDSVDNVISSQKDAQQQSASNDNDKEAEIPTSKSEMINSDCKNFASEEDFLRLRKRMAGEDNDKDMIRLARKAFRSRCFTTAHIKNLGDLFMKDEGKYNFFDASYPFVSDSNNFSTLESQLTDTYYISRFKAMIHN